MDTPAATPQLDAVDDQVVVVGSRLQGVCREQFNVFIRQRCRKGMMGRREASCSALPGICLVVGREHGEVCHPKEFEPQVPRQQPLGHGGLVKKGPEGAQGCRTPLELLVLAGLEDDHVPIFQVGKLGEFAALQSSKALKTKR